MQGTQEEVLNGAIRSHLARSGIPVECSKGEWGKGQHDLNVRYSDALSMADRHAIFKQCAKEVADGLGMSVKQCAKEVADGLGMSVTFMAKYDASQSGSSCHLHLSLWREGCTLMDGPSRRGNISCSETFRWFLGGWIAHVPDFMPFYAPTVNSYKRYRSGSWAATRLAWSYDNRTASFPRGGQRRRFENRMPHPGR